MANSKSLAVVLAATLSLGSASALAQRAYPTPDAAAQALVDAISRGDTDALRTVLGPDWKRFVPAGGIDMEDVYAFLEAWAKQHKTVLEKPGQAWLAAGDGDWTLPVPIVQRREGWRFDPAAGAELMRSRRIGRNELDAMQAALAYFDAQKDYALKDRDGNGVLEYAQKFVSSPGKHDGLYWPDDGAQGESPLGALYVAGNSGHGAGHGAGEGYHGYRFKILKAQGANAAGGAYDYVIGGRMRSGFALIATPLRYGDTGIMSFMVSHDGTLYEKDLGPASAATANAMTRFDPDPSWRKVVVPGT